MVLEIAVGQESSGSPDIAIGEITKGCWSRSSSMLTDSTMSRRDRLDLLHIGADHGMLANQIDEARNALGIAMDKLHRIRRKNGLARAGDVQLFAM